MWTLHHTKKQDLPEAAVSEAAAFLNGTYARYLQQHGSHVPVWSWLNVLAHGNATQIVEVASGHSPDLPRGHRARSWRQAVRFISLEMIDRCDGKRSAVADMQASVLQPLEDRLIRGEARPLPTTPAQLVATALMAMTPPSRSERHTP